MEQLDIFGQVSQPLQKTKKLSKRKSNNKDLTCHDSGMKPASEFALNQPGFADYIAKLGKSKAPSGSPKIITTNNISHFKDEEVHGEEVWYDKM